MQYLDFIEQQYNYINSSLVSMPYVYFHYQYNTTTVKPQDLAGFSNHVIYELQHEA